MSKSKLLEQPETQYEREQRIKYEDDPVQAHFRWTNEMLIDGIPLSKWQKLQEDKCPIVKTIEAKEKVVKQNEERKQESTERIIESLTGETK